MDTHEQHILLNDLVGKGIISQDQALLLHNNLKVDVPIFTQLQKSFGLDAWVLAAFEAEKNGALFKRWSTSDIDAELLASFPLNDMQTHSFLPVQQDGDCLYIAFSKDDTLALRECVRRFASKVPKVSFYYVPHSFLEQGWSLLAKNSSVLLEHLSCLDDWSKGNYASADIATKELLAFVLTEAHKARASDVHFEPEHTNVRIRFRVDGKLQDYKTISKNHWSYLAAHIKVCGAMNSAEQRKPQSGRFTDTVCGVELDVRVASYPTINGESLVLRLLDKHKVVVPIENLGFDERALHLLRQMYTQPQGLVLFTGPTGSGKTTTLYSILNQLNAGDVNIMTLEDPVEYELKGVRQTSVQEGVISFKEGIRAMLRQDPDIVLIGEIRDEDTAQMCFRASQTGHLVFSTLHTNNVWGVFPRLMDLGVSFESIKQSLVGVVSQRLLRKVCAPCKGVGCESCNNVGFIGRTAIGEVLLVTNDVRSQLTLNNLHSIYQHIEPDCYVSLAQSAQRALEKGITKQCEINKYNNGA